MRRFRSAFSLGLAALLLLPLMARAEEPAHYTFSPKPPGTIVQSMVAYLAGEAMHSQWRVVASNKLVGKNTDTSFYQWYLSIYAIEGTVYHLKYQSPKNGGPMDTVEKAHGAQMWYPLQEMKIVGTGEFMQPAVQQVVVQSHQTGADCGGATVTVFAYNAKIGKPAPAVTVNNGCDLNATIVHGKSGDVIRLDGPYYSKTAAMCCPTKPKATALLRYRNGKWVESPNYFEMK